MKYRHLNMIKRFIGPAILVFAGAYMLRLSWFKWPDVFIDYGRELYVPWQITQGKVLYADLNHLYGPLAHYINAFLFQVFGVGLSTLVYFNICLVILLTFLIYDLFRSTFGDFIATTAGLCFLVIFAFSQYVGIANYNFICPYSHDITYGIFLFFLTLFVLRKYLLNQKLTFIAIIGFLSGLIFLTKVEVFIAGFTTILICFIFIFWQMRPLHMSRHLSALIFFFLLPIIAFFIYFSFHMPAIDAFRSITASFTNIFISTMIYNPFTLWISGFDNPVKNFMILVMKVFGYTILLISAVVISYLYSRLTNKIFKYGWIISIFLLVFVITLLGFLNINWMEIARPYPFFILLFFGFLIINLIWNRKDKSYIAKFLPFTLLSLFSFLLLLKMILNVHFYHYGFALAMPASLVMIALLLHYIPAFISRWGSKTAATGYMALFICLALFSYFNVTNHMYAIKNYALGKGRDRFFTFDANISSRGPIINETLKYIEKMMLKTDTFIVLPESVMLNYLSKRNNPIKYFEFTPNFVRTIGEENILKAISLAQPSFILLSELDTSEHGDRYFGKNYARNIYSWIANNFDNKVQIGAEPLTGKGFGIMITKRK